MIQILTGDCLAVLPTLPERSVQCCVTSPPYWGLRDYGTATWEGGSEDCDHKRFNGYPSGLQGSKESTFNGKFEKQVCGKCGARRIDLSIGLESTPAEYIERMVAVFQQVWRVLRDDGTLWVNLGDSYASGEIGRHDHKVGKRADNARCRLKENGNDRAQIYLKTGLKPKDLCGIPWRVALALQADGWYLRSDIIWSKPNPMPESVTDRCTKAHEYIFMLTKRERYFYDADAIREENSETSNTGGSYRNSWKNEAIAVHGLTSQMRIGAPIPRNGRNKRTVWEIPTQPYAEAHFATFPEELPKLCILAGTKPGDMVLDPFGGSGTVGKVAIELGRKCTLIELNPAYVELARKRTYVTPAML